jgi:membrane protease YdiL (CAAX protease family)
MTAARIAFTTPPEARGWKRWLLYSPGARIVAFFLATLILGGILGAIVFIVHAVGSGLPPDQWAQLGKQVRGQPLTHLGMYYAGQVVPAVVLYYLLVRLVERRRVNELALRDLPGYGAAGLILGAGLFSLVVGVLWVAGSYHVVGFNPHAHWLIPVLVVGIGAGISEEILMRGVLYRILEEGMGTWWALAISAAAFGFMHLGNPNATVWSSLAIAVEAGISFALLYHVTRSLWMCMGLHAAWNIMQGTVYGISVSGTGADGFLVSRRTGPDWLSGGPFGAEASVVALACCSALSVVLLVIALRRGSIVAPSWVRNRREPLAQAA